MLPAWEARHLASLGQQASSLQMLYTPSRMLEAETDWKPIFRSKARDRFGRALSLYRELRGDDINSGQRCSR
jgi:hypothetical protein